MANTERLAALAKVRTARNAIQDVLAAENVSAADRTSLQGIVFDLNELEDLLILADISEKVDALRTDSDDLGKTVAAMTAAGDKVAKAVALVDVAAKALGGLADVVAMAASHGLIS